MIETGDSEALQQVASLREYFRGSMHKALTSRRVTVDEHTACYVVNLLTLFARSDRFYTDADDPGGVRPLALQLNDALNAATVRERGEGLRRLGDVSLFVAGFFSGSFRRRPVDIDYYIAMGGTAYSHLSDIAREMPTTAGFAVVYDELSEKFQSLVEVLNEISEQGVRTGDNAVRLYDIWQKTGSPRAARMLREQGIVPIDVATQDACRTRQ